MSFLLSCGLQHRKLLFFNLLILQFALIFIGRNILVAQNNDIIFERINTSNGLSNNTVQSIFQDSEGYLWIATADGINKYDGYNFISYRHDPQDVNSLSQNRSYGFDEDHSGRLWITTEDGLDLYNRENENFKTYRYTKETAQYANAVISVHVDKQDRIWVGTVYDGLIQFIPETQTFSASYLPDSAGNETGVNNAIFKIISDPGNEDRLWLGFWQSGLAIFNIKTKKYTLFKHNPQNPESLSNDQIRGLFADNKGNIWIGTHGGGLNKFDPEKNIFTHYTNNPKDPSSLSSNNIWSVYGDPHEEDILWVATENGLDKFNTRSNTFTVYKSDINDQTTLSHNLILDIYKDRTGVSWVGTAGGLDKIDPGRVPFHQYTRKEENPKGLNSNLIYAISKSAIDPDIVWVGTYKGGLNMFNRQTNTAFYFKYNAANPYSIDSDSIRAIYEDPDEAGEVLWVGTAGAGLDRFDIKKNHFVSYKYDVDDPKTISSNLIRQIYETRDGMLWITTAGGLNKFDRKKEIFTRYLPLDTTYSAPVQNLLQELVDKRKPLASILKVGDNENRNQSFKLSQKTKVLAVALGEGTTEMWDYGWLEDASQKTIWKLKLKESKHAGGGDKNRMQIWAGTLDAGTYKLHYKSDDSHSYNKWNVPAPIHPNMWGIQIFQINSTENTLITQNINKFEKPNSITGSNTTAILEDSYGMLWIGTQNKGLSKFDRKTEQFTNYTSDPANPRSIRSNFIQALYEDKRGILWIGTRDGLAKYDSKTNTFKTYTTKDGLVNDVIINILEDNYGSLWLATNNGISKFDPADEAKNGYPTFINYNIQDGLQYNQYFQGSMFRAADGEMFFGGYNGFVSFYPGKPNVIPPHTLLSKFLIFNNPVEPGPDSPIQKNISETKEITLSYDQNVFSFEFVALHFSRPEKNQYLYKMEGFDKNWIDGHRRFAPYTNLDPGEYTFRVKASNSDGIWNDKGASLKITILPPWWYTTWAYIGYGLFFVGLIFGIDRLQRRRILLKTKERMKIQEAEHRAEAAELEARAARAENERKTKELEEARSLQLSMLPKELPQLPHLDIAVYMQTATEVGGDYYDFHVALDGTLTVVVGDATGHGMKAGTMVTTAKSLFNSYAPNPDILFSFREITRCIKQMNFDKLSMCMTMLKIKGNQLQISTAGMPPSFIFRRDTRVVEEHMFKAMPLGTMDNFPYEVKDTTLSTGDTILLMSDGLPELRNNHDELYGYKKIRNGFEDVAEKSPEQIISYLKTEGASWVNNADPDDDVTFVVIKVK